MAITRKQALNRIAGLIGEGLNTGIEAHIGKLTRPRSGPHIRVELSARLNEIERLAEYVGSKSGAELLSKVAEWRTRISELKDVHY
jgi:hypothetical protein